MANQFSAAAGAITKDHPISAIDKSIDVNWMRRNEFVGALAPLFDIDTKSGGLTHVITNVGSALPLPVENEDTEDLPYFTPADGFKKTFTVVNYRSGIRVTDTMLAADRFDVIVGMTLGQMKSGFRKDEYQRSSILNNAFSGTAGADSLPLCDTAHPQENPEAGTWSNDSTGALALATLQTLRLIGADMTDEHGDPDPVMYKTLVVPTALQQTALELTSFGDAPRTKPGGGNNDPNVLVNQLQVVTSPYLTSAVRYFLVGDRTGPSKGLHEVALQDWNLKNNNPANADILIDKRIKSIKTFGFTTSKNIAGSTGV